MATPYSDTDKDMSEFVKYIDRGLSSLKIRPESRDISKTIRNTIESKANGMILWAKLMFEILSKQRTEEAMRQHLETAPLAIHDMITTVLKVYSSTLKARELEEFNLILAWLTCAARPISVAEMAAVLSTLSPIGSHVISLERRLREDFGTFISLVRDDGLPVAALTEDDMGTHEPQSASTAIRSLPETTRVVFSHASMTEYFKAGKGKFSHSKAHRKIGVVIEEAHLTILRACLDTFVTSEAGMTPNAALTLQPYSMHNWFIHLEGSCAAYACIDSLGRVDLVHKLHSFLGKQDILQLWCRSTEWPFYTEKRAQIIADWIQQWTETCFELLHKDNVMDWAKLCMTQPVNTFLPIAKINAKEGLHNSIWWPKRALLVVAQIKALIHGEDTLDILPFPTPVDRILAAVEWQNLEKNVSWHRKLAVCFRNLGHTSEAVDHFQTALVLDEEYVEARRGLSYVCHDQKNFLKVIELESANVTIMLRRHQCPGYLEKNPHAARELSRSYENLATSYEIIGDDLNALRFLRKAITNGTCADEVFAVYLKLLQKSDAENWLDDAIWALQEMEAIPDDTYSNRLVSFLPKIGWPSEYPEHFFHIAATAVSRAQNMPWLIELYNDAIAKSPSHITILIMKVCLVELHKKFRGMLSDAEPLIQDIIYVTSQVWDSQIDDPEQCKKFVAQDFCKITIRNIVVSQAKKLDCSRFLNQLVRLCRSGVRPLSIRLKIDYGENSDLYLAIGHRLLDNEAQASAIVASYIRECCNLLSDGDRENLHRGLLALTCALIVLGQFDDATDIISHLLANFKMTCDRCCELSSEGLSFHVCRYCLTRLCSKCAAKCSSTEMQEYCIPGHQTLCVAASFGMTGGAMVTFRGSGICVQDLITLLQKDFTLN